MCNAPFICGTRLRQGIRRPADQARPREGPGAAEGVRLRRHAGRHDAPDRPAVVQPGPAGRQAAAREGRLQGRPAVDGLADRGVAPRPQGAAGARAAGTSSSPPTSRSISDNPGTNAFAAGACDKAWFGWPCDPEIEKLRAAFIRETDPAKQKALGYAISDRVIDQALSTRRSASTRPSAPTARTGSRAGCPGRCRWSGTSARRTDTRVSDAPLRERRRGGEASSDIARVARLTPPARAAPPASAAPLRRRACRALRRSGTRWRRCPRCPGRHWPAPSRRSTRRCG